VPWPLKASLAHLSAMWREAARFMATLHRFREHLEAQRWPMLLAVSASVGFTAVTLLEPWTLQIVFDGVLLDRPLRILGWDLTAAASHRRELLLGGTAAAVLLLAILRGQLYYAQNVLTATSGIDVVMAIRRQLFAHLQALSLDFHHRSKAGDLLMRMTGDIVMLREMVVAALITLLTQGLVLAGILCVMITINLRLTLVTALVAPALFLVLSIFRIQLSEAARRQRRREGRLASAVHEVLGAIQLVQANTAEKFESHRFKEMNKRSLRSGVRLTRIEAKLNRSVQIALAGGLCLILWLGSRDVLSGRLSPGQLLVFLAYLRGLYKPLRQVSKLVQRMAKASACGDRVLEVLDLVPRIEDPPHPTVLRRVRGVISFRGVTFSYETAEEPTLRGVDLDVGRREMVALVGPTGAGKTTILSLIPRFYDPREGVITIDGIDIRTVRLRSLRRQISLLTQEAVVMGASIYENIAYGALGGKNGWPPEAEIEAAARGAGAHDFVRELPKGYQTIVGERGVTLSGGQRQRIAIARAILRRAPILLLDEPTTGLDPVSGRDVMATLRQLVRKQTTVVVAHHLNTVLQADRILFLEGGTIREQGSHRDLLRRGDRYAEFFETEWGGLAHHLPHQGSMGESLPRNTLSMGG